MPFTSNRPITKDRGSEREYYVTSLHFLKPEALADNLFAKGLDEASAFPILLRTPKSTSRYARKTERTADSAIQAQSPQGAVRPTKDARASAPAHIWRRNRNFGFHPLLPAAHDPDGGHGLRVERPLRISYSAIQTYNKITNSAHGAHASRDACRRAVEPAHRALDGIAFAIRRASGLCRPAHAAGRAGRARRRHTGARSLRERVRAVPRAPGDATPDGGRPIAVAGRSGGRLLVLARRHLPVASMVARRPGSRGIHRISFGIRIDRRRDARHPLSSRRKHHRSAARGSTNRMAAAAPRSTHRQAHDPHRSARHRRDGKTVRHLCTQPAARHVLPQSERRARRQHAHDRRSQGQRHPGFVEPARRRRRRDGFRAGHPLARRRLRRPRRTLPGRHVRDQ